MGWAPFHVRKGDRVCILMGGQVPYILRPIQNGEYQLIGEAYFHGLMHGEGTDKGNGVEKIVLR